MTGLPNERSNSDLELHGLHPYDLLQLKQAANLLEHPNLAIRFSGLMGTPIAAMVDCLPKRFQKTLSQAVRESLAKGMHLMIESIDKEQTTPRRWLHRSMVMASGATCGALGAPALVIDLPFTTCVMLRSIASIAKAEGEDLDDPAARVACMEVFALGGPYNASDHTGLGYFAVRQALAKESERVALYLAANTFREETAPVILKFLEVIAQRFGLVVGEKVAAQLVPVVGAVGGVTVNLLFMNHFQGMAHSHFTVRRLERTYGHEAVRQAYLKFKSSP